MKALHKSSFSIGFIIYVFGHHTAPYGIFCRYVKDITLRNIKFTWNQPEKPEWGSPVRFESAANIEISGFKGRQSLNSGKPDNNEKQSK